MNTVEFLLGEAFPPSGKVKLICDAVNTMHATEMQKQKEALLNVDMNEIRYRKGKVTALWEVIQFLQDGKIPTTEEAW